jgi:hypothetical protein
VVLENETACSAWRAVRSTFAGSIISQGSRKSRAISTANLISSTFPEFKTSVVHETPVGGVSAPSCTESSSLTPAAMSASTRAFREVISLSR